MPSCCWKFLYLGFFFFFLNETILLWHIFYYIHLQFVECHFVGFGFSWDLFFISYLVLVYLVHVCSFACSQFSCWSSCVTSGLSHLFPSLVLSLVSACVAHHVSWVSLALFPLTLWFTLSLVFVFLFSFLNLPQSPFCLFSCLSLMFGRHIHII